MPGSEAPGGGVDNPGEESSATSAGIQPLVVPEPVEEGVVTATPRDAFGINSPRGSGSSSSAGAARGVTLLNLAQAAGGSEAEGALPAVSSPSRTHTSGDGASAPPSDLEDEESPAGPGAEPAAQGAVTAPKPEGRGARSILNAFPAGLLSLAGGSGGDSASAEEAQRLRLQVRAHCSGG